MRRRLLNPTAALLAALALALAPSAAEAQGSIRGVLFDSLRSRKPVSDAEVVLLGTDRTARTDGRGRFEFEGVPAGTSVVAWWAPWVDSVGLPPLRRAVTVLDGTRAEAVLTTPSPWSYQRMVCGTTLPPGQGIQLGRVLQLPDREGATGAVVRARWGEVALEGKTWQRSVREVVDTTDDDGRYTLCGVPLEDEFELTAWRGTARTGQLIPVIDVGSLVRRDLLLAQDSMVARVQGRVADERGRPLSASVLVYSAEDSAAVAPTDDEGRFLLLRVPTGSQRVGLRSIGYQPVFREVELDGSGVDLGVISLARVPQQLDPVRVTGRVTYRWAQMGDPARFAERQAAGLGRFLDDSAMNLLGARTVNQIAASIRGARVVGDGLRLRGLSTLYCRPRFWLDGFEFGPSDRFEEEQMYRMAKRMEVYDAIRAPPGFTDFSGCGVVLIWTRGEPARAPQPFVPTPVPRSPRGGRVPR